MNLDNELMKVNREVESMIYVVRGQKVMLDFELAKFYGYETRDLNNQVKHNIEKFDETFMFQLTKTEWEEILMWKNSTANFKAKADLNLQNSTAKINKIRFLPHAFTEQGVYMLMTVLKGDLATKQSILLIKTFKAMKDYVVDRQNFLSITDFLRINNKLIDHDKKISILFDKLLDSSCFKHILILDGEKLEADVAYQQIYSGAKHSLVIVDDYINVKTLQLLKSASKNVSITIITDNKARDSVNSSFIKDFTEETENSIKLVGNNGKFHDRYILIDFGSENECLYHCGGSSKDAGKRITTITKIDDLTIYKEIFTSIS